MEEYVDIGDKVKFPSAVTLFVGNMADAARWLHDKLPEYGQSQDKRIIGLTGDYAFGEDFASLVTTRHNSTQTAGGYSTQTAEIYSTQTAGDDCTHTVGDCCYVTSGEGSVVIHRWYDKGRWRVKTCVITGKKAGQKFFYKKGKQIKSI